MGFLDIGIKKKIKHKSKKTKQNKTKQNKQTKNNNNNNKNTKDSISLPRSRFQCRHATLLPTNGYSHSNHIPFLLFY